MTGMGERDAEGAEATAGTTEEAEAGIVARVSEGLVMVGSGRLVRLDLINLIPCKTCRGGKRWENTAHGTMARGAPVYIVT